ncbi:MAG: hypothetical protein EBR82_59435 [Caulobacteraceae bacterium]|nr:hypothetical protein [Caulobacteraceae bacterium]
MNHASGAKSLAKHSASVASSATFTHEIDTAGFRYLSVDVLFSPFTASNVSIANVLRVSEADTSGATGTNVSGLVGGTDFTIASTGASTGADIGGIARFNVDLRGRKRYLTVRVTPSTTVAMISAARLSKGEQHAVTASEANVNNVASV